MKIFRNTAILVASSILAFSCQPREQVEFTLDSNEFTVGADGGTAAVEVSSPGPWTASANKPWVTVSPANGNGSQSCRIIVDSALVLTAEEAQRQAVVTIQGSDDSREITVTQQNYGYIISPDNTEISVPDYEGLAERYFDVTVKSNIDFIVGFKNSEGETMDADTSWIKETEDNPALSLNKGNRPRNVKLRFSWKINQQPGDRVATVVFTPVNGNGEPITVDPSKITAMNDVTVTQTAAAPKPTDPRAADSTAIVSISRALNVWSGGWDTSVRMERWSDVELWEEGDTLYNGERIPDDYIGRVRYVRFFMFNTEDGLPYQVGWLDAAEELVFYSNENYSTRKDIELGEEITGLHNLRRLTVSAYGLNDDSFPDSFFSQNGQPAFPHLEYLEISSNNFQRIDPRFNADNFPALKELRMRNNQIRIVYDLSNATTSGTDFARVNGGLYLENQNQENSAMGGGFPVRFFLWDNLETFQLTLNYLEGSLPTDDQIVNYLRSKGRSETELYWHSDDVIRDSEGKIILSVADSIGKDNTTALAEFDELMVPKVLPRMMLLSVNLNRFSGDLSPDHYKWIYYHPNMDWWEPSTFIFTQEGTDSEGTPARFSGIPTTMNYYYKAFPNKHFSPTRQDE